MDACKFLANHHHHRMLRVKRCKIIYSFSNRKEIYSVKKEILASIFFFLF